MSHQSRPVLMEVLRQFEALAFVLDALASILTVQPSLELYLRALWFLEVTIVV